MVKKQLHNNIIGILSLCVPYSYSLFYALKVVIGINNLQLFCATLFLATIVMIFIGRFVNRETVAIGLLLSIFLLLFFVTRYKYGYVDSIYSGTFLSFIVRAFPAAILADYIARKGIIKYTIRWLEPFMYIFTITTFIAALAPRNSLMVYQEVSYYGIFAYTMNVFLIIYREKMISEGLAFLKSRIWIVLNIIMAFIQIFCMFVGGGRGAFVLFIIMSIILGINLLKNGKKFLVLLVIISLSAISIFVFFPDVLNNILELTGVGTKRLFTFFDSQNDIEGDQRYRIYMQSISIIQKNLFFGTGIGSVFYELGNYAHNWVLDILIDTGVIGLFIVIIILLKTVYNLLRLIRIDWKYSAILFMLIEALTNLSFSGCYLSDGRIWFCIIFALIEWREIYWRKYSC